MYDKGVAERLTELVGDMFEMEVTYMFGGFGYLMNTGSIRIRCFDLTGRQIINGGIFVIYTKGVLIGNHIEQPIFFKLIL